MSVRTSFISAFIFAGLVSASPPSLAASPPPTSWEIAGQFNEPPCPGNQFGQPWQYGMKPGANVATLTPLTNFTMSTYPATNAPPGPATLAGCRMSASVPLPFVGHLRQTRIRTFIPNSNGPITLAARAVLMHPGPNGQRAVVRFIAPTTSRYCVSGSFYGIDGNGTQTTTRVEINSVTGSSTVTNVFSGVIDLPNSLNSASFTTQGVQLAQGEFLDFEVDMGQNYFFDSTGLHGVIELQTIGLNGTVNC